MEKPELPSPILLPQPLLLLPSVVVPAPPRWVWFPGGPPKPEPLPGPALPVPAQPSQRMGMGGGASSMLRAAEQTSLAEKSHS